MPELRNRVAVPPDPSESQQARQFATQVKTAIDRSAPQVGAQDIEITEDTTGLILRADDGHRVRVKAISLGGGLYTLTCEDLGL